MRAGLFAVGLLGLASVASAQVTLEDVQACVARNLPDSSGVLDIRMEARDREGGIKTSVATLLWRREAEDRSRALLRISAPPEVRGTAVLLIQQAEQDPRVLVYLPEIEKVRRVRKGRLEGSLLGTDFSYEDFERLQGNDHRTALELREPIELGGRPAWVLEARPHPDERSIYARVVTFVDQEACLPIRMEFFDRRGKLRKLLTAREIRREGERFLPGSFRMRDLRDATETRVSVERLLIDPGLAAEQLSEGALTATSPRAR